MTKENAPRNYYLWPVGIVVFFVFLAIMNIALLWTGLTHYQSPVEPDPYERGLRYQQTIDELNLPGQVGWQTAVQLTQSGNSSLKAALVLLDAFDQPILDARVSLDAVYLPSDTFDQHRDCQLQDQAYVAYLPAKPGAWRLSFVIEHQSKRGRIVRQEVAPSFLPAFQPTP